MTEKREPRKTPEHPTQACIDRAVELYAHIKAGRGLERIRELLEGAEWQFAKTMADNPHWYCLRDKWEAWEEFYACCLAIRLQGRPEWWPSVTDGFAYVALDLGGYHYWTMGFPFRGHKAGPTYLINRKPV